MPQVIILNDQFVIVLMQNPFQLLQTFSWEMTLLYSDLLLSLMILYPARWGIIWLIVLILLQLRQCVPIQTVGILLFLFQSYTLQISSNFSLVTFMYAILQYQQFDFGCLNTFQIKCDILDIYIYRYIRRQISTTESMSIKSLTSITILILMGTLSFGYDFNNFEIVKADKAVQLNAAYPTQINKVQYKCIAAQCNVIYFILEQQASNKVSNIAFTKDKQTSQPLPYTTDKYTHNGQNFAIYHVKTPRALHQDQTFTLVVAIVHLDKYINYPENIDLTQDQKFQYKDSKQFLAPYLVKDSTVTYKFSKIIGFEPDGEKKGLSMVAFKASDVQPFTITDHRVHGVNNEPQVLFSQVLREIEVSHWGNIAITQFYKIRNLGPGLKGQFSRVQFSSNNKFEAKNAWRGIQTNLPYQIWGLYYRDEVGNVSTSRAFRDEHNQVVRFGLVPRYALLGGWKANWEIGYNLKTKGFLTHDGNQFQLNKIPIQYAFSDILAEKYTIKLILPEGASNTKLFVGEKQINMNTVSKGVSFGYLDYTGRPTFTVENLRGNFKSQMLKVNYELDTSSILKKPLIVFGAIFSILVLLIVVKRLNMSAFEEKPIAKTN